MQVTAPDRDEVRRLAEVRLDRPVVLSLYLDLDPAEFATPSARATAVRSLLDEADRRIRDHDELPHDDRMALRASLERATALLEGDLPTEGAQALAVFAAESAGMFEALKLPRPLPNRVAVRRSPLIAPLARLARRERWCVALVNRRAARIFRGSQDGVREVDQIHDTVFGQHDQGGLSQARYQRGIEKEKDDHLKHTADVLMKHFKRAPFERLLAGGPREVVADFEAKLHGYLTERYAGRIEVDVEHSTPEQVHAGRAAALRGARGRARVGGAGAARRAGARGDRAGGRAARAERAAGGDAGGRRALRGRGHLLPDVRLARPGRRDRMPRRRVRAGAGRRPDRGGDRAHDPAGRGHPGRAQPARGARRTAPAESRRCCASRPGPSRPRPRRAARLAVRACARAGGRRSRAAAGSSARGRWRARARPRP